MPARATDRASGRWLGFLLPVATLLVMVVAAVLLLMTPLWMHGAVGTTAQSLATPDQAISFSDPTVSQLLFGGDFYIDVGDGYTFYTAQEVSHLRDARAVLYLFLVLAALSAALIAAALVRQPRDPRRWRALARGGSVLVVATVVLGVVGAVAFDAGFELFHRVFFPGGNWEFPADSNMIRLYPYAFWQLTAAALGVLCVVGGGAVWFLARRRAARLEARA